MRNQPAYARRVRATSSSTLSAVRLSLARARLAPCSAHDHAPYQPTCARPGRELAATRGCGCADRLRHAAPRCARQRRGARRVQRRGRSSGQRSRRRRGQLWRLCLRGDRRRRAGRAAVPRAVRRCAWLGRAALRRRRAAPACASERRIQVAQGPAAGELDFAARIRRAADRARAPCSGLRVVARLARRVARCVPGPAHAV